MKSMKFLFLVAVVALIQPMLTSCDKDEQQDIVIESVAEQNAKKIESYNVTEVFITGISTFDYPNTAHKFKLECPYIIVENNYGDKVAIHLGNLKSMYPSLGCLSLDF